MKVKYRKFCVLQIVLKIKIFKFDGTVFVSSIISSHVITELSKLLTKYFPFLQAHGEGFQI